MISRKDFREIARILGKHDAREDEVNDFIDWLKTENPNFRTDIFRDVIQKEKKKVSSMI